MQRVFGSFIEQKPILCVHRGNFVDEGLYRIQHSVHKLGFLKHIKYFLQKSAKHAFL